MALYCERADSVLSSTAVQDTYCIVLLGGMLAQVGFFEGGCVLH